MAPAPAGRQWNSVPCRAPLARGDYVFSRAGFSPGGRARDAAVCSAWLQDEGKDVLQVPLCVMEDHAAAAATWPPQTLVDRLIAARSPLSCYRTGSERCRACHFAMELPLALARASDAAVLEGDSAAGLHLLESAVRAAGSLAPTGCGAAASLRQCL